MWIVTQFLTLVIFLFPTALLILYIRFKLFTSKYWSDRGVPHLQPLFLIGNTWKMNIFLNFVTIIENIYSENKKNKVTGFWLFTKPALMINDLDIAKKILIKDFNHFPYRGVEIDTEIDPLSGHLFLLQGPKWRNLRVKLTPTFTSGKMKFMYPTMAECGDQLNNYIYKFAKNKEVVEVKDLLARFTTDVISSCAFGIETKSLENPDSEFRKHGNQIFQNTLHSTIITILRNISPAFVRFLKLRAIQKDINDFFISTVKDTVEYRQKNNIVRNDFLQILIEIMKAGKVENVDKAAVENLSDHEIVEKFSLNEAAAQCFVFFAAGFETSASALTYGLYELALNPDVQKRLQDEIDEVLDKHGGQISYETMNDMEYMDKTVEEILRKYPSLGFLQRKCTTDYPLPEMGFTIEKGTKVFFSVKGIQRDPDIYPNPDRFDPERFSREEKKKRHPMAYLPFGEGPRSCIGNRFGLMQMKIGLISILKDFKVDVCEKTPIPIVFHVRGLFPSPVGGMPLIFSIRK